MCVRMGSQGMCFGSIEVEVTKSFTSLTVDSGNGTQAF